MWKKRYKYEHTPFVFLSCSQDQNWWWVLSKVKSESYPVFLPCAAWLAGQCHQLKRSECSLFFIIATAPSPACMDSKRRVCEWSARGKSESLAITEVGRMSYEDREKVAEALQEWFGGDKEVCQWISVSSTELKSAFIIDGKVQKPLKCGMGVLDGGWVCSRVWKSGSLCGNWWEDIKQWALLIN